jgi:hypothetical protein
MTKLFASLVFVCLSGCAAIPYRVGVTYGGMMASYDGKSVRLDIDGNELGRSLSGYAK